MDNNVILWVTVVAVVILTGVFVAVVIGLIYQRAWRKAHARIRELEAIVAEDLAALKECDRAMTAMALEIYGRNVLERALGNAKRKGTN